MTINERLFSRLRELSMTQKEFSDMTGIAQTTISEWKKKKTNPTSEKIMSICEVLKVSPEWLLTGADADAIDENETDYFVVARDSEIGYLVEGYKKLNVKKRERLIGFMEALS